MADMIMTEKNKLEKTSDAFIEEFCTQNSAETSMIIAGMMSIIKGNEKTLENMKNQKWFQRIWFTLTGKNNATVKEMQLKRDELCKYLVKIISKLTDMVAVNSAQAADLSNAVIILDDELRNMKVSVDKIARALNDKILSLDNYTFITNDIRNKKYPADKPLLSLIDIMSQLDSRTAKDKKRLLQLKETMENSGFSFSEKISAKDYAQQVFTLSDEKVGRILLFCQDLSERSRFLAYTAHLIENYFYLGKTDRELVIEQSDEAINDALWRAGLSDGQHCKAGDMYTDLSDALPDKFNKLIEMAKLPNISACIVGKDTTSKSELLDALNKRYENITAESVCFKPGNDRHNEESAEEIKSSAKNGKINCIVYCVDVPSAKFEDFEAQIIGEFCRTLSPEKVIIALINCINKSIERELSEYISSKTGKTPIAVLVNDFETKKSFGLDELVDEMRLL